MPTANVYIDGFNFYYRCVKGTPYKWLDFSALVSRLLPGTKINRIRYFTARVRALPHDLGAPARQQVYLRALETVPNLTITYGHFLTNEVSMRLASPPIAGPRFATVLKTDEKGSDVNLASYRLLDAFRKEADTALVVSNDSDLATPISLAKAEFKVKIGITLPRNGQPSRELGALADFTKHIRDGVLRASQFPDRMHDAAGAFSKPPSW